jgi:hypothetical protein
MNKRELKNVLPLLELFTKLEVKEQTVLLKYLNSTACKAIIECIHNGMWNTELDVNARKLLSRKLRQHCKTFRYLNNGGIDPVKKHKKLVQVGAGVGVGLIVNTVLPLLAAQFKK